MKFSFIPVTCCSPRRQASKVVVLKAAFTIVGIAQASNAKKIIKLIIVIVTQ